MCGLYILTYNLVRVFLSYNIYYNRDIFKTVTGKVDEEATTEEQWKSYLAQLVQCYRCNRTFTPDRLEVHQRSCKGVPMKK